MNTQYIRGNAPLHKQTFAAATTLVFAGIFILLSSPLSLYASAAESPSLTANPLSITVTEGVSHDDNVTANYDGDETVSYELVAYTGPHLGTLQFNADGSFTYSQNVQTAYFTGNASFAFVAKAGELVSAPATVSITITPIPDTEPPILRSVEIHSFYGEVSGNKASISVSLTDYRSDVAAMCLWIGNEASNLLPSSACKDISEKDWNSYNYAPSFRYEFDSTLIPDGSYPLYVYARDAVGNAATSTSQHELLINNESLGSVAQPALISSCAELQAVNDKPGWYYEITNDIDCSETKTWNRGAGFSGITIGKSLVGNNHTISNVYMDTDYTGVMSPDSGGIITGVNLRDVDLSCASSYCGGFAHNIFGSIEKSSITGTLNCSGKCGGYAAQHSGSIKESWADLTINGQGASGFAGHSSNGLVQNSYFKGHLGTNSGGGITGLNDGWNGTGMVENSYAANTFSLSDSNSAGGLIGWQYKGDQANSYWDKELSGVTVMCGQAGTNCEDDHGLTTEQMKDQISFVDWDFADIWAIDPDKNDGYPYLLWQTSFSDDNDNDEPAEEPEETETPKPIRSSGVVLTGSDRGNEPATSTIETEPLPAVLGATNSNDRLEQIRLIKIEFVRILKLYLQLLVENKI